MDLTGLRNWRSMDAMNWKTGSVSGRKKFREVIPSIRSPCFPTFLPFASKETILENRVARSEHVVRCNNDVQNVSEAFSLVKQNVEKVLRLLNVLGLFPETSIPRLTLYSSNQA